MDPSHHFATSVRRARPSDAAALADLINHAYDVEQFFVDGERTSAAEIAELTRTGVFLVLEYDGGLAAAVYVEPRGSALYFGMLAVARHCQGMGLGTRLVRIAEAMAEAIGATHVSMRIVNLREELARWYRGLGYREIGVAPYTHRPVKQACHFVDMEKRLVAAAAAA